MCAHLVDALHHVVVLILEFDDTLRQRNDRLIDSIADATDRRLNCGQPCAGVFVDALFHRQHSVDCASVVFFDTATNACALINHVLTHRAGGLIEALAQCQRALVEVAVERAARVFETLGQSGRRVVHMLHESVRFLIETTSSFLQFFDSARHQLGGALETILQRCGSGFDLSWNGRHEIARDTLETSLYFAETPVLIGRKLGEAFLNGSLQGTVIVLVCLLRPFKFATKHIDLLLKVRNQLRAAGFTSLLNSIGASRHCTEIAGELMLDGCKNCV